MPDQGLQRLSASVSAGYDKYTQEVTIEFQNGQSYSFTGVPPDVWEGLAKSSSPGRYYNARIRGVY
jgi:hypothetical protein